MVTELGIIKSPFRLVQSKKASWPIVVTELGMAIDVSPLQPEKAELPIEVTVLGIFVFLQPITKVLVFV